MRVLRIYFGWIFALSSSMGLWAAFQVIQFTIDHHHEVSSFRVIPVDAILPLQSVIFGFAFWFVQKGKAGARFFGAIANLIFVSNSLVIIFRHSRLAPQCVWIMLGIGIVGLGVFVWPDRHLEPPLEEDREDADPALR